MVLLTRAVVFSLAFLSFACLLGTFYGLWSMHVFGCWILPPATGCLVVIALATRHQPESASRPYTWIVEGTLAGLVAAVAYDSYRLPYVLAGTPLFKVFPRFGQLLLNSDGPAWMVHSLGWAYHFSNGAALGIMFLCMVPRFNAAALLWGAVAWASFVEMMLLLTPYTQFFGLPFNSWFIFLTGSAHLVFGTALGWWLRRRLTPAGAVA
jgi:hypothetical protein